MHIFLQQPGKYCTQEQQIVGAMQGSVCKQFSRTSYGQAVIH